MCGACSFVCTSHAHRFLMRFSERAERFLSRTETRDFACYFSRSVGPTRWAFVERYSTEQSVCVIAAVYFGKCVCAFTARVCVLLV